MNYVTDVDEFNVRCQLAKGGFKVKVWSKCTFGTNIKTHSIPNSRKGYRAELFSERLRIGAKKSLDTWSVADIQAG